MFAQTFSAAGEKQEKAADKETAALLKRFEAIPTSKRRRWISTVLKKSRSGSIRISVGKTSQTGIRFRHAARSLARRESVTATLFRSPTGK